MSSEISVWQDRIVASVDTCSGKPRIAGTRITVDLILELLAENMTWDAIIEEYPHISKEDIRAVLEYSSYLNRHSHLVKV